MRSEGRIKQARSNKRTNMYIGIYTVFLYISQDLDEELSLATEAFLESESVTVDLIRREVGETPQ